jgi:signal transduction histidine kinase
MTEPRPDQRRNDTDGEVVYRRVPVDRPPGRRPAWSRIDPTLMPLLVGCISLLLFVLVLGNLSVRRVEDTSRQVLELEQQYAARATLLLRLRIALTRLDNEARNRAAAQARQELRPPFDLRLTTARNELSRLIPLLAHAPLSELPRWRQFRDDLEAYVETTRDANEYSLRGFERFQRVDAELDEIITDSQLEQEQIFQRSEAMQRDAARSIRLWSAIAIIAGLFVTAGTILESQRRFGQTRRSMEEARREREFSNQMLEGMVSAIAAIDRQDRIRSANSAFFQLFPNVSVGASIHSKVGSPEANRILVAATASHVAKSTYRGRWNLNDNGDGRVYDAYSSPLEIDGEHGQLLTLVDVTQAAAAEAEVRRTEALAAVGEAAAQLAHEIKNPLGSIRLGVSMLRDNEPNDEALKTISLVERGISHLNKLVVDVTQFSRHRPLDRSEVDLHELIDSSLELVADRILEKQALIEQRYADESIRGYWDPDQLSEVLVNLLANGIDVSDKKAKVEISTALTAQQTARIVITDHGGGIGEKALARIFEPFFTTKKRGTGLGLAIVRRIIDMHGGTISVVSEQGKGTSFQVELPLGPGDRGTGPPT